MVKEIQTRTGRMYLGEDGILRVIGAPGAEQTLADAQENLRKLEPLLGGGPRRPALIDYRSIKSVERAARAHYSGPESAKFLSAVALIVGSPVSRIIGSFFLGFNRPQMPLRLFTDEAEALAWLKHYVE